ncbi:hypothetical protein HanRHA438_Chr09g0385931 [Helianthus annuus]|nr:hypothetical protein HanRHA438_Chr09g0385931 [Helianthus annuus]
MSASVVVVFVRRFRCNRVNASFAVSGPFLNPILTLVLKFYYGAKYSINVSFEGDRRLRRFCFVADAFPAIAF